MGGQGCGHRGEMLMLVRMVTMRGESIRPSDREVISLTWTRTCDSVTHKKPLDSSVFPHHAPHVSLSALAARPASHQHTGPGPTPHLVTRTLLLGLKPSAQGPRLNHARAQFSRNNSQVCSNIVSPSGSSDIICYITPSFDQTNLERTKNSRSSDLNAGSELL